MGKRFQCIWAAALAGSVLLAGCASNGFETSSLGSSDQPSDERPSDEPVALGKVHYAQGSYGLAERQFRRAVESNPHSAEGWLGLAASYDRLARFDHAERAYKQVLSLRGRSAEILNNLGYHYMLRGDLQKARSHFQEAARKDPGSPHIQGNMRLLETWKTGDVSGPGQ